VIINRCESGKQFLPTVWRWQPILLSVRFTFTFLYQPMKAKHFLFVILITAIVSCHKEPSGQPKPPRGLLSLKLKDINVPGIPSPFYHFEYNNLGNITMEGFEAGLKTYNVDYNGNNIVSMEDTADPNNKVRLEYEYSNGELLAIKVKDKNGFTFRHCIFSFSPSHQLLQMDWDTADGNVGFYLQQTLTFTYYPDGNLLQIVVHNYAVGSQVAATITNTFENYDDNANADGFSLLHTNFHDLLLIPGLKFQINNPRRVIHTGDTVNFDIEYMYTYDDKGRPTMKKGNGTYTVGTNAAQPFKTESTFSYYD